MNNILKKLIVVVFFFFHFNNFSQTHTNTISIEFNEVTKLGALKLIEQKSSYLFSYQPQWFKNDSTLVSKKFQNANITTVLNFLFKESTLNYFLFENTKIILTKNSRIHKSRYRYTEVMNSPIPETKKSEPVFINFGESLVNNKIKTIKIGKENFNTKGFYTLSGFVKKKSTQEPIANLTLLVRDKNRYATTNSKGYYSIRLPYGSHIIEPLLPGIEKTKTKVIIYSNGTHNFNLLEYSKSLDEVVIESNSKRNTRTTVTGITHLKLSKIKTIPLVLGERDILKVATTLPGIKTAGEGSDGVNVRGGKTDQNLFLLDNSVLYSPTHFLGLFSAVNPFTTKSVDIYKGFIPAEHGGRISSVFNLETKKSNTEKITGEASLGVVTSNISVELPVVKKKSGLIIGARGTYSNWILKAIDNKSLKNSSASFFDITAKYNHDINKNNSVILSSYYSSDKYSIASDTTNTYRNKIIAIEWNHKFNEKNNASIQLSNSSYAFDIDFDGKSINNFKLKYDINETNLKALFKYTHSNTHKFDYGISSKLYDVNPGDIRPKGENSIISSFNTQKEKALESALFIADNISVNDKLSFNIGARFNLFSVLGSSTQRIYQENSPKNDATVIGYTKSGDNKTYNGLSFRFSSRYSFNEELSIKASFNNAYQFIHRLVSNTTASPTDKWKLSDLNIKPQEALQASLGLYKNISGNKYEISIEGYYKEYKNILDYKVGASLLLNDHIETETLQGVGKSYGAELLIRKNIGNLNGWLSYSYSRSLLKLDSEFLGERVNNGEYFSANYDKPHDLSLIMNYKLTKRYSFSANFTYQTGRPITYPIGKYLYQGNEIASYSDRNKFRIPNYYRFDLGINIEGNHKVKKIAHSFWNISIYNLFGRSNPYSIFFTTEEGKVKAYQSSIFPNPIPTITYNLTF